MRQWRPTDFLSDANGKTLIVNKKKTIVASTRRYSEVCVQVVDSNGRGRMLRALLDSGCSKSIILKQFTGKKRQSKLMGRDRVEYATYGGKFQSKSSASVGFKLIEFANKQRIDYKFHVDELQSSKESRYNMIIGSDLLNELSIDIIYSDNCRQGPSGTMG
jgi:hypothetical protein